MKGKLSNASGRESLAHSAFEGRRLSRQPGAQAGRETLWRIDKTSERTAPRRQQHHNALNLADAPALAGPVAKKAKKAY